MGGDYISGSNSCSFFLFSFLKGFSHLEIMASSSHAYSYVGNSFSTLGSINSSDNEGDIRYVHKHG
jgi:hypothetical protein